MTERYQVDGQEILSWLRSRAKSGGQLKLDSREVAPGDIFIALKGAKSDAVAFAPVAAARGASGMLYEKGSALLPGTLPSLAVDGLRERLGFIARDFYHDPSARMMGIAVTGTNGKTSTSHWLAQLLSGLGHPCAAIGTIGCFLGKERIPSPALTTPDAASAQRLFSDLAARGGTAFAIEASSIGLEQGRLAGTSIHTAVFTNLTRDHLDYHGSMENYEAAKAILFDWPRLKCAVINADDPAGLRLAARTLKRGVRTIVCTLKDAEAPEGAQLMAARNIRAASDGMHFDVLWQGAEYSVQSRVVGLFNVSNLLGVAAAAISLGMPAKRVFEAIDELRPPAGRMQTVSVQGAPLCIVDYSHTPDALEKAIAAARPIAEFRKGRIWTVFGAGGDRDKGKRPIMGAIAARDSDEVVVTSDNPRSEDPAVIAGEVAAGARKLREVEVILDRREAIISAVCRADEADVVLVAGKGHEDYQEIQGVKHHFDDAEVIREAFIERKTGGAR
jgi:UDP-N-acetylmuramyl-tripeptide synthetase